MHPLLSSNILILLSDLLSNDKLSLSKDLASLAASDNAIYSASLVDKAVTDCWYDLQLIAPPLYINSQPVVDFLLSKSVAKSASA